MRSPARRSKLHPTARPRGPAGTCLAQGAVNGCEENRGPGRSGTITSLSDTRPAQQVPPRPNAGLRKLGGRVAEAGGKVQQPASLLSPLDRRDHSDHGAQCRAHPAGPGRPRRARRGGSRPAGPARECHARLRGLPPTGIRAKDNKSVGQGCGQDTQATGRKYTN